MCVSRASLGIPAKPDFPVRRSRGVARYSEEVFGSIPRALLTPVDVKSTLLLKSLASVFQNRQMLSGSISEHAVVAVAAATAEFAPRGFDYSRAGSAPQASSSLAEFFQ
jgi:hypothetical protein